MNVQRIAAPAWRSFDLNALAWAADADRAFLGRIADRTDDMAAAAAYQIAARTKPRECATPRSWVRYDASAYGLLTVDADGNLWVGRLDRATFAGRVSWLFEITAGPFPSDFDPRPTRQVDPRKAKRQTLSVVSEAFAEAA